MGKHSASVKKKTAIFKNLVDIALDEKGKTCFLVKENDKLILKYSVIQDGEEYLPPSCQSMPWLLPEAKNVIEYYGSDNDMKLFNDIVSKIKENSYLPDPPLYHFLAAWVLHTHLLEHFNYSPMIIFYAVHARGKTRTASTLLYMSWRGVHVETIREPDIIRKASRFTSTMFFDIRNFTKKAERLGSEDVLLGRFNKGITIPRVTNPERRGFDDTQHFKCFGPTLIASNEPIDEILNSRGIDIQMVPTPFNFEHDLNESDFLYLKERCLAFRARWLDQDVPFVKKPSKDRLGDILRPIAQVYNIAAPELQDEFYNLINQFLGKQADRQADTVQGLVIKSLLGLKEVVKGEMLSSKEILLNLNRDKPDRYHTSPQKLGRVMQSLGFEKTRFNNERGYIFDPELLNRLAKEYGYAESIISDGIGGTDETIEFVTFTKNPDSSQISEPPAFDDPKSDEWAGIDNKVNDDIIF